MEEIVLAEPLLPISIMLQTLEQVDIQLDHRKVLAIRLEVHSVVVPKASQHLQVSKTGSLLINKISPQIQIQKSPNRFLETTLSK